MARAASTIAQMGVGWRALYFADGKQFESDRLRGAPVVSERLTTSAYLTNWLADVQTTVKPATWTKYEIVVRLHLVPGFGTVPLAKLDRAHLAMFYKAELDAGLSARSVHHLHRVLHTALEQAARDDVIVRNVAPLVKWPRVPAREMHCFTREQAHALVTAAADGRLSALYALALSTGMREGEFALALRWKAVALDGLSCSGCPSLRVVETVQRLVGAFVFSEPKTARSKRRIGLTPEDVAVLRRHRAAQVEERLRAGAAWTDNDLVFPNTLGNPIEPSHLLYRSLRPLLDRAELPAIRFHDLRHTAATLLIEAGMNIVFVSELLGHASVTITLQHYGHVTPTMHSHALALRSGLYGS